MTGERRSIKIVYHKLWPVIILVLIVSAFFARLFYPKLSFFATPDFGQSDIWQLNLPAKYFLAESLKNHQWPLWNSFIGGGFPTLAEGQIGTFNLLNLLTFRFLPFSVAFNLGYILIFLTAALGTYFYCRLIKFSRISSMTAGFLFAFSGIFVTHISHLNLIQTASFLPWLFLATDKLLFGRKKIFWGVVFAFILSQQIFSGFPQTTFISLLGIIGYYFYCSSLSRTIIDKTSRLPRYNIGVARRIKDIIIFIFFIILGFAASSIQLLPQKELLDLSNRAGGFGGETATMFSYPFKHLITLISPYQLGDPRQGTYPDFIRSDGSIFWENTAYIGVIPLILMFFSFLKIKKRKVQFYWLLLLISFLLMTGKYSPLYFLFPFPPFSYFRVPSRFILLFCWSMVMLAGFGFDVVTQCSILSFRAKRSQTSRSEKSSPDRNRDARFLSLRLCRILRNDLGSASLKLVLMTLIVIQLWQFSYNYNPILPASEVLKKPEIAKFINTADNPKIFTFGSPDLWNRIFLKKGWQNPREYLQFKNALSANFNLVNNLYSYNIYQAQTTRRYNVISNALSSINATPSALILNLLQLYSVGNIITPFDLKNSKDLTKVGETADQNSLPGLKVYQLNNIRPLFYLTDNYFAVTTLPEFFEKLNLIQDRKAKPIQDRNEIFLEKEINLEKGEKPLEYSLTNIINEGLGKYRLILETNKSAVLVFNNSYYPGWKASINGEPTEIFPVNINQMGVLVEKGKNEVIFSYEPDSFKIGKKITIIVYFVLFTSIIISFI